jgi:prepilin-type N-terminal cleavage/methylation domain-containing protein
MGICGTAIMKFKFMKFINEGQRRVKGFTLIELLIVISIIGILAALVTFSFTSSQRQARNTQRKSDLAQYRTSIETYANLTNGAYPISGTGGAASNASDALCTALVTAGVLSSDTLCPEDPSYKELDSDPYFQYRYQTDAIGNNYALWADMENGSNYWVVCANGQSTSKTGSISIASCP